MSRIHPKARTVGYVTIFLVLVVASLFLWLLWNSTQKGHEHLMLRFEGSGELIGALQPDDPVLVRGVDVGQVQAITQSPGGVHVLVRFWGHQEIFQDALAVNTSHSLMGQRVIDLDPGRDSARPLPREATVPGYFDPGIAETMSQIYKVLDAVTAVRETIVLLVSGDSTHPALHAKLMGILEGVDRMLQGLESVSVVAERSGPAIQRIGAGTRQISREFPGIERDLQAALRGADSVLIQARIALQAIQPMLDSTRGVVSAVSDTAGPLKHLVHDDAILTSISRLQKSLETLMTVLEGQIPMKFKFHILGSNPSKRGQ